MSRQQTAISKLDPVATEIVALTNIAALAIFATAGAAGDTFSPNTMSTLDTTAKAALAAMLPALFYRLATIPCRIRQGAFAVPQHKIAIIAGGVADSAFIGAITTLMVEAAQGKSILGLNGTPQNIALGFMLAGFGGFLPAAAASVDFDRQARAAHRRALQESGGVESESTPQAPSTLDQVANAALLMTSIAGMIFVTSNIINTDDVGAPAWFKILAPVAGYAATAGLLPLLIKGISDMIASCRRAPDAGDVVITQVDHHSDAASETDYQVFPDDFADLERAAGVGTGGPMRQYV